MNNQELLIFFLVYSSALLVYSLANGIWNRSKSTFYAILMLVIMSILMLFDIRWLEIVFMVFGSSFLYARVMTSPKK